MLLRHLEDAIQLVDRLMRQGEYADAITVMAPFADDPLPDLQQTIVAYNVAQLYAAMGHPVETLGWYDWGLPLERALRRTLLAEAKAGYLVTLGRRDEAAAILRELLAGDRLDADGRARVEAALREATTP